ncbi:hypothetical protein HNQ50_001444 [Silvimonas terrae]|uniref:Uncharacterized protein n=1 Tax=Silvimonas terrae TaxID=300266 RepID=A0A840REI9_9NEIS|nr:hypothetical protein [Silvimonas terrae]
MDSYWLLWGVLVFGFDVGILAAYYVIRELKGVRHA